MTTWEELNKISSDKRKPVKEPVKEPTFKTDRLEIAPVETVKKPVTSNLDTTSPWSILNEKSKSNIAKKEATFQKEVDPFLFEQLRLRDQPVKELRQEAQKLDVGIKDVVKEIPKTIGSAIGAGLEGTARTVRASSEMLAIPLTAAFGVASGDSFEITGAAIQESIDAAVRQMTDENISISESVDKASQRYLQSRGVGRYGDNDANIVDVGVLAFFGFANLFGDPAFEFGLGLRGLGKLRELATYKKVGTVMKPLAEGGTILRKGRQVLDMPITPNLKIKITPQTNSIKITGYKKRFPTQTALPEGQLAPDTKALIMQVRESSGVEVIARFDGEDLILKPKIVDGAVQPVIKTPPVLGTEPTFKTNRMQVSPVGEAQKPVKQPAQPVVQPSVKSSLTPKPADDLTTSIQKAKSEGKSFDEWVKRQGKNDPLLETAKDFENADDFISFYRGSSTQYGKYKPEIRKFGTTEESIRVPELGVDPEKKITIYRGLDESVGRIKGKINDGDFVTTDFDSANAYTGGKVVSKEVKAKDLILDYPEKSDFENPFYKGAEFIYSNSKNKLIKYSNKDLADIFEKSKSYKIKVPLEEWEKQLSYIQKNGEMPPNADIKGFFKSPEYNKYGTDSKSQRSAYYEYASNQRDNLIKTRSQLKAEWDKVVGKADDITTSIQKAKSEGKSFDEWVKRQEIIYHGTPKKFDKFNTSISEGNATWFTADKKDILDNTAGAVQPAGAKLNIMERYHKKGLKLATPEQAEKMYTDELIAEGYAGVKYPKGEYGDYEWTKLFNPNKDTRTRSQLKAEWDGVKTNVSTITANKPAIQQTQNIVKPQSSLIPQNKKETINKKIKLIEEPKNETEEKIAEFQHNTLTELEMAEKGERISLTDDRGYNTGIIGKKSTFPQWVPEKLRSRKLFDAVLPYIGTNNVPTKANEIRLYNAINDHFTEFANKNIDDNDPFQNSEVMKDIDKEIPEEKISRPRPVESEGKVRKSTLGKRIEKELVNKKILSEIIDLPEYRQANLAKMDKMIYELIANDINKAVSIGLGFEDAPEGILNNRVWKILKDYAKKTKDVELGMKLAKSNIVGSATRQGQEIVALRGKDPADPVDAIIEVNKSKKQALGEKIKKEVDRIKNKKPKIKKETWESFVESIKC